MKQLKLGVVGTILVLGLVSGGMIASAQSSARARAGNPARALTVEDVIKLNAAGLSEDIIIQQIRKKGQAFDLSTDQLIALKTAHVSDRVVEIMLDPSKADADPAPAVQVPPPLPLASREPERNDSALPVVPARAEPELPAEIGIYSRKDGQWVEVSPELVYWKTGGVLKTIGTAGLMRGDVNGHVPGVSSHTSLALPLELLIVAPDGVAMSEYQLLRLRCNHDNREFRTVTGGLLHSQGGAIRDLVTFDGKKLASRVYEITLPGNAGPGEYGILPPGSTNGAGKIYSFRVAE